MRFVPCPFMSPLESISGTWGSPCSISRPLRKVKQVPLGQVHVPYLEWAQKCHFCFGAGQIWQCLPQVHLLSIPNLKILKYKMCIMISLEHNIDISRILDLGFMFLD